jgi:hypothetical protein
MENRNQIRNRPILYVLLLLFLLTACALPLQGRQPDGTVFPPTPALPSPTLSPTGPLTATPAPDLTAETRTSTIQASACSANPITAEVINATTADSWLEWVKQLSGAKPVLLNGQHVTFTTRYNPAMFNSPEPNAFDFVLQTIQGWYPAEQIEVQPFSPLDRKGQPIKGKNLILSLPGAGKVDEVIILSAHLDSKSNVTPEKTAPGAEDNASGSAALLEAARLFRGHRFERTIRIIWFTAEEQGLLGSKAYVKDLKKPREIQAVINLDMFGYDSDNDRCFEMHVGTLPASDRIGQCFLESNTAYNLGLPHPDYLTGDAINGSDHYTFWHADISAIEILENMFNQEKTEGCSSSDMNSAYHTPNDTYDRLNPDSAIRIVRAALATIMALAGPIQ